MARTPIIDAPETRGDACVNVSRGGAAGRRSVGLARLAEFVDRAGERYAQRRNFDLGPEHRDNVSLLSPYIRHRLILEQEALELVLARHSVTSAEKFVQEIFWRTYFKGWLEQRPSVWHDYRQSVTTLLSALDGDASLLDRYTAATSGATGIECFDSWVAELIRTGYLHNHARMWFASIWVYTLELPWQLGADFFYRHLTDGDPASNTLGWRWVCGLHTRGKTYLARASNISRYTANRFDPGGQLASSAPPLVESKMFPISPLPDVPEIPRGCRYGLLVTEEDARPESLRVHGKPEAITGALATAARSPLPVGELAAQFAADAVSDAIDRAARRFGADAGMISGNHWPDELLDWATELRLDSVITAYTPVGPVAERLDNVSAKLAKHGITLYRVMRRYDTTAWPYATRGYFKLRSRIPEILRRLGVLDAKSPRRDAV